MDHFLPVVDNQRLDRLYGDVKRFDMFTRRNRPGWSALGDQVARTDYVIDPDTMKIVRREDFAP